MSTLILLPLFFSSFAFLACACWGSDVCSLFGCRTSVRACISPQKCSLSGCGGNRLKLCVRASGASSCLWEQEQNAGGGCRMAGSEGCPGCCTLHVDIVISGDKPWGQCLWVMEIWEEECSCKILFMHCFQQWGSVQSLLSAEMPISWFLSSAC